MVNVVKIFKSSWTIIFLLIINLCFSSAVLAEPFEEGGTSPILDTIKNFFEYQRETLNAIEAQGGDRQLSVPQWDHTPG